MSGVRIVTGYVPLSGHPRPQAAYDRLYTQLQAIRGAPITTFVTTLERCWLKQALIHSPGALHATADNPQKNTLDYHAVQHQKTAWLADAAAIEPEVDVVVWIDYGIFSIPGLHIDHIEAFLERAKHETEIALPGCWDRQRSAAAPPEAVNWRFCGGVAVVPRRCVLPFHNAVRYVTLHRLVTRRYVTWEVNDWARVEESNVLPIRWYSADHNQTLFTGYKT